MLLPSIRRALQEAVRYGTLHVQAFVDVDTAAQLEGLHAVLAARAEFRGVVEIRVVAFPQDGVLRDRGAAELCEEALRLGAEVVGGIPWIEHTQAEAGAHIEWATALAARTGRPGGDARRRCRRPVPAYDKKMLARSHARDTV